MLDFPTYTCQSTQSGILSGIRVGSIRARARAGKLAIVVGPAEAQRAGKLTVCVGGWACRCVFVCVRVCTCVRMCVCGREEVLLKPTDLRQE